MRTISVEPSKREVAFNTTRKGKEQATNEDENESDATKPNFVRKLKKGPEKYRGKLPFKLFDCDKIGHFAVNYPYKKKEDNYVEDVKDKGKRFYKSRRRNFQKKKVLYSIHSDFSNDESESVEEYSEDEKQTSVFMAQEILNKKHSGDQSENIDDNVEEDADVMVDLEGELVCALEELKKVRKEFKKYKKFVIREHDFLNRNIEESNSNLATLTTQLDEAKRMYKVTKLDLENKEKKYQKMEEEIVNLRKELEKCKNELKVRIKYESNTDALDKMLSKQKHSKDIEGVGFEVGQCSNSKDSSDKEILFTSSIESEVKQTFIVNKPNEKMIYVVATNNQSRSQHVDPKIKANVDNGGFTKVKSIHEGCAHEY